MTISKRHPLIYVMNNSPINRQAAIVASQKNCVEQDFDISRQELIYLTERLERKHKLLKNVLQIKTKAQHKNFMYKYNKRIPQFRMEKEPRAFVEYVRVGQNIQKLIEELAQL